MYLAIWGVIGPVIEPWNQLAVFLAASQSERSLVNIECAFAPDRNRRVIFHPATDME